MKILSLVSVSCVLLTAVAPAQPPAGGQAPVAGPIAALQAQVNELAARVELLEGESHSPPSFSVEGRTYCSQLATTSFLGGVDPSLEADRVSVLRAEVTFSGGVLSGNGVSNWQANQDANGQVNLIQNPPPFGVPGPLVGQTYVQNGRRIDLMVGTVPWTLYVSADGSLIYGDRIFLAPFPLFTAGGLSTIVYIEDATGAGCNPEAVL